MEQGVETADVVVIGAGANGTSTVFPLTDSYTENQTTCFVQAMLGERSGTWSLKWETTLMLFPTRLVLKDFLEGSLPRLTDGEQALL